VVINQINLHGVPVFIKTKEQPPVAGHMHGIKPCPIAAQRMQAQAWEIHIGGGMAGVQPSQKGAKALHLILFNAACVAAFVKGFQALMPEAPNHTTSCNPQRDGGQAEKKQHSLRRRALGLRIPDDQTRRKTRKMSNDNQSSPLEIAKEIMRKHLASDLAKHGEVKLGLTSASLKGNDITCQFPDWIIKSRDEVLARFGEAEGWAYFKQATAAILREVGAMK
jgi:hypothetical protein